MGSLPVASCYDSKGDVFFLDSLCTERKVKNYSTTSCWGCIAQRMKGFLDIQSHPFFSGWVVRYSVWVHSERQKHQGFDFRRTVEIVQGKATRSCEEKKIRRPSTKHTDLHLFSSYCFALDNYPSTEEGRLTFDNNVWKYGGYSCEMLKVRSCFLSILGIFKNNGVIWPEISQTLTPPS